MKIFKVSLFAFLLFIQFYFTNLFSTVRAENEFSVNADVTYEVTQTGKTRVTHDITLENNLSTIYATTYSLSLENIDVSNVKAFGDKGIEFPIDVTKNSNVTNIKVNFSDVSVGKGAPRHFNITYDNSSFAVRTGEIWEVSVPKLGDQSNFQNYKLILKVPKNFGLEAYISPKPDKNQSTDSEYIYYYNRDNLLETGVSAGFGQFQVFSYNLSYHLENPLSKSSSVQIALPPDTAFQKVYIQEINPKPDNVNLDQDGNWLATYSLSPRQRIDVVASGFVQIFASFRSFPKVTNQSLNDNLKPTEYWQSDNPKIIELASNLKTARAIYDYVSENLKYDISRVQPNVQRMGALNALNSPYQAICMEFTDLFIALSRAAGIPAREVNGYAYTENPDLQPLGLVADVLHSWPEYYDQKSGVWIPVDPTWGSTTGGENFFDKLDLRHFAFVIHGQSSVMPYPPGSYKLGPNPQKDVFVSFGQLPETRISIPEITIKPFRILPFLSSIYNVTISNPGPTAIYSPNPTIYYDNVEKTRDLVDVLPPYSTKLIQISLPHSFLGKDMPSVIKVAVGSSQTEILTNKKQIVVDSLLIVSVILIVIMALILIKVKKIKISNIFAKIASYGKRKTKEVSEKTPEN
jgi:transglutaminase-like putative cysteine protease